MLGVLNWNNIVTIYLYIFYVKSKKF
jgi:hypothetical protein